MRLFVFALLGAGLLLAAGWLAGRWVAQRVTGLYPPIGERILVAGRTVHLFDRGPKDAGPFRTIVMIHGASGNLREMAFAFAKKLPDDIRMLAIDRPGHGYTERIDMRGDADLGVQARMIAETMAARGIDRAVILAHSLGGAVAMRLALDHPERVSALVLLAPVTHPWPGGVTWYYDVASLPVIGPVFSSAIAPIAGYFTVDKAIEGIFLPAPPPPGYRDAIGAGLVLRPQSFRANALDVALLLPQITEQSKRYGLLKMPVLIMTADEDTVVSPTIHSAGTKRDVPQTRLVWIHGAGHAPHQTRPDIVIPTCSNSLLRTPTPRCNRMEKSPEPSIPHAAAP